MAPPLLGAPVLLGASRQIRFDHLSLEQGLSQGAVNCIVQDRRGFMWFGTQDGLNRFDGYSFIVYKNDPRNPGSLSGNTIWSVHEDGDGFLWIGIDGGGLNRLDPRTNAVSVFRNDPSNPATLSSDRIRVIHESKDGSLWIGTDGAGLNRMDKARTAITRYLRDPSNPDSPGGDQIRAIAEEGSGILWIGSDGGGLDRFDSATGRFKHFRHDPRNPGSLGSDRVRSVLRTRDGAVWVGTYAAGLDRLDPATGRFTHFRHDPKNPASLSDDKIWTLFQDAAGTLWIGTDGGLNEWLPGDEAFARYLHQPTDPASLSDSRVLSLAQDRGGVMWVGTQGSGLDKWSPATGSFALYRVDPASRQTMTGNTVQAFATEADGTLWVGTYEGLNRFDSARGSIRTFRRGAHAPGGLSDDRVMSLLVDHEGTLWVGTLEGGLHRFDRKRNLFASFPHDPANPRSLGGNGVTSLLEDDAGNIWAGVFRGGLNRFDRATETFVRYRHDPANPASLSDNNVLALAKDSAGVLWIGTERGGLNRFDRASGAFVRYRHDPQRPESLGPGLVFCIHEDRKGTLWVGTQGGGLSGWSREDRRANRVSFRHHGEVEGLPNDTIYGILEDDRGTLWLSTNRGLAAFDPATGTSRNFDRSYGLQSNEFNFGAWHRSAGGEMFFGGNDGFNAFFPDQIRRNGHVPQVVLTGFLKFLKRFPLPKDVNEIGEVRLNHQDYVVSFEFAALDYAAPAKNRYAYRLEGFDRGWIEAGEGRRATYTNLDAGSYVFRVKASNNDGLWNEEGASLRVLVSPPPWKSWWAYTIYGLAFVGIVASFVRSSSRKLEREAERSRLLEAEVARRTREIEERNAELQHAIRRLEEASLTDSLTGLHNRRFLMSEIGKEIALIDRYYGDPRTNTAPDDTVPRPDFVLMMVDLDGLKPVNDTYGHAAGDCVLLQMRDVLEKACRRSDTMLRWGGDEFVVIGRFANRGIAETLAERILTMVREHPFDLGEGRSVNLSCCIGFAFYPFIASAPRSVSWEQVVTIADRALYVAKASGRNAWVGLFSTTKTPLANTAHGVNVKLDILALDGSVEIHTSVTEPGRLVLTRA